MGWVLKAISLDWHIEHASAHGLRLGRILVAGERWGGIVLERSKDQEATEAIARRH